MAINPDPKTNLATYDGLYQPGYTPNTIPATSAWPYTYPTVYTNYVKDPDAERFRFALELIADGGLTKEAIEKIAKQALRRAVKAK